MDFGLQPTMTCLTTSPSTKEAATEMMDHKDFELSSMISKDDIDEFSFLSEVPSEFYE